MSDKDNKNEKVADDEVMITTKMSDLEKMLEGVEKHADKRTDTKFERFFMPALIVFGLLALGGFTIIYSITQDMTKLARAMDPQMGGNMTSLVRSVDNLSKSVEQMNQKMSTLKPMLNNMQEMNHNMVGMQKSMLWMQRDISSLRSSFAKPMGVFNAMPFL
jgi:cell division protein FtsB